MLSPFQQAAAVADLLKRMSAVEKTLSVVRPHAEPSPPPPPPLPLNPHAPPPVPVSDDTASAEPESPPVRDESIAETMRAMSGTGTALETAPTQPDLPADGTNVPP